MATNEDVKINEIDAADTISEESKVLGLDDDGNVVLFNLNLLSRDNLGEFKTTDAAPPTPLLNQYYELIGAVAGAVPSGTYTNLLGSGGAPIVIPSPATGNGILWAKARWNGTFWVPIWQERALPMQDLSAYTNTAGMDALTRGYNTPPWLLKPSVLSKAVAAWKGSLNAIIDIWTEFPDGQPSMWNDNTWDLLVTYIAGAPASPQLFIALADNTGSSSTGHAYLWFISVTDTTKPIEVSKTVSIEGKNVVMKALVDWTKVAGDPTTGVVFDLGVGNSNRFLKVSKKTASFFISSAVSKSNALLAFKSAPLSPLLSNPVVNLCAVSIATTAPSLTNYTDQVVNTAFTADTTAGSNIITVSSATGLTVGRPLIEQGSANIAPTTIPLGTTITAIDGTTVTMSNAALATKTALGMYAWSSKVNLIGGFPFRYGSAFTAGSSAVVSANPSVNMNAYVIEFLTDAANISNTTPAFIISLFANGGGGYYRLAIDDHYQSAAPISYGSSLAAFISVTLPTPGIHKVRIELQGGTVLYHIYAINNASFFPPKPSQNIRVAMYSDSYFASGNSFAPNNLGFLIPTILGWTPDILSVGGTGYINTGGTNYNFADTHRLDDVTHRTYDAIIIQGSVNDPVGSPATITGNALTVFQGLRSRQPNATFFIFGCMTTATLSAANATIIENAVKAAFDQWGDTNAYFIPITTANNGAWITSATTGIYIAGDGVHPSSQVGQIYLAQRYANAILNVLKAQQVFIPGVDYQALSAVTNNTTSALSAATLNSTYPLASPGFRVICESISGGAVVYIKGASSWLAISSTVVS